MTLPICDACSGHGAQILLQGQVTSIGAPLPDALHFRFAVGRNPRP
jgi:hypothetical protein